jgi:hypothetical protein
MNADIDRWFSEFQPVRTDSIDILYALLLDLNTNGVCCFLTDTYVCYLAGLVNDYESAALFVVLTDCPAVRLLFRREIPPPHSFHIGDFIFTAVDGADDEELDSLVYNVSHSSKNFSIYIIIHGVDTTADTGPSSNIDFVYFIWRYLERFSFKNDNFSTHHMSFVRITSFVLKLRQWDLNFEQQLVLLL